MYCNAGGSERDADATAISRYQSIIWIFSIICLLEARYFELHRRDQNEERRKWKVNMCGCSNIPLSIVIRVSDNCGSE